MYALNFYSPMVADQLRTGRKSATIRLGDKSDKYKKGMIVQVLCGNRYSPRERIFDAVIDKVEVKALGELSPREIEHDNPEIRRTEDFATFLRRLVPHETYYAHDDWDRRTENICEEDMEAPNGHAHVMSMFLGSAGESIPVGEGELCMGQWQRVLFIELDRSRPRRWICKVVGS